MKTGLALVCLVLAGSAHAVQYRYVDWTSASGNTVSGSILMSDSSVINVSFTGTHFASQLNNTGTFYWTTPSTYQSSTVDNAPNTADIIQIMTGGGTFAFSMPVTGLVMDFLSVGQSGAPVTYTFDHDMTVISNGPGYFGNGPLVNTASNAVRGEEGHGSALSGDTLSSLSFTLDQDEFWHGFTVAVPDPVPEPGSMIALGLGVAALLRKRR